MNIKAKDTVVVISGKDKGTKGKVNMVLTAKKRVIVEGVAIATRHQKPKSAGMPGGIIHKEAAIDVSNVMLVCDKCNKATRVAHKFILEGEKQKKVRVCKKCNAAFDN